jgi:hypothetical protein
MQRAGRKLVALASAIFVQAWIGPAAAIDLLTGDGYLLALSESEVSRKAADNYLAGTLDGLMVLNEVMSGDDSRMFCLSDERASVLDSALLRQEFTDWLRAAPEATGTSAQESGAFPVAILSWAFLAGKFPCAEPAGPGEANNDILNRLLESRQQ